jgi:hypothetical protein
MEIDDRIDFEELRFHPNKLVVLWWMADFIRSTLEELIAKDKLEKWLGYHQPFNMCSEASER